MGLAQRSCCEQQRVHITVRGLAGVKDTLSACPLIAEGPSEITESSLIGPNSAGIFPKFMPCISYLIVRSRSVGLKASAKGYNMDCMRHSSYFLRYCSSQLTKKGTRPVYIHIVVSPLCYSLLTVHSMTPRQTSGTSASSGSSTSHFSAARPSTGMAIITPTVRSSPSSGIVHAGLTGGSVCIVSVRCRSGRSGSGWAAM